MNPDAEKFWKPSVFGFPEIIDGGLKMAMYPFCDLYLDEAAIASTTHEKRERRKEILKMARIEQMMAGKNFQRLDDTNVWVTSMGSPPVPHGEIQIDDEIFTYSSEVKTIRQWVTKYFIGQLCNTYVHSFFTDVSLGFNPGCIYFLDVTEGTILSTKLNVITTLSYIKESASFSFSLLENEKIKTDTRAIFAYILQSLIDHINTLYTSKGEDPNTYEEPLWFIFILIVIKLFQYHELPSVTLRNGVHLGDSDYDYRLRFYLVKRRGRFIHTPTEPNVPANLSELLPNTDLSEKMWLAMAQYYRLLILRQKPHKIPVYNFDVIPPSTFVFRDPHACSTTRFSAYYDSIFFSEAKETYSHLSSASTWNGKTFMVGVNPIYKYYRHASTRAGTPSWVFQPSNQVKFAPDTFGVLAGVCWFYNPERKSPFFDERYDPILLLPFNELDHGIPTIINESNRPRLFNAMPNFFTYGVDEYILSRLVIEHFHQQAMLDEINLLFFTIHWIRSYCGSGSDSIYEYYPITSRAVYKLLQGLGEKAPESFGEFVRTYLIDKAHDGLKYTFFNTMFGNIDNQYLNDAPTSTVVNKISDQGELFKFLYHFHSVRPYFSEVMLGEVEADNDCFLALLHRYDRPNYWLNKLDRFPNTRISHFSPRIDPTDGKSIIPNNRSNDPRKDLSFVLKYKIKDIACLLGTTCAFNTKIHTMGFCDSDPRRSKNTWGGSKKTRKAKNKKRRHTRRK